MPATVGSQIVRGQTTVLAGDTLGSTTSATPFGTSWAMPANFLTVGRAVQIVARGVYSTAGVAPGNLTFDVLGGTYVLCTTGAQALTLGLGNNGWELTADVICGTTGVGGAVEAQGFVLMQIGALTVNDIFMVNTAGVSFDTTLAKNIGLQTTFSATGNTITQRQLFVEIGGRQ